MAQVAPATVPLPESRLGPWIVLASAVAWSFGGIFARLLGPLDPWTVVFWRSGFAAAFLIGFMALRDGPGRLGRGCR